MNTHSLRVKGERVVRISYLAPLKGPSSACYLFQYTRLRRVCHTLRIIEHKAFFGGTRGWELLLHHAVRGPVQYAMRAIKTICGNGVFERVGDPYREVDFARLQ